MYLSQDLESINFIDSLDRYIYVKDRKIAFFIKSLKYLLSKSFIDIDGNKQKTRDINKFHSKIKDLINTPRIGSGVVNINGEAGYAIRSFIYILFNVINGEYGKKSFADIFKIAYQNFLETIPKIGIKARVVEELFNIDITVFTQQLYKIINVLEDGKIDSDILNDLKIIRDTYESGLNRYLNSRGIIKPINRDRSSDFKNKDYEKAVIDFSKIRKSQFKYGLKENQREELPIPVGEKILQKKTSFIPIKSRSVVFVPKQIVGPRMYMSQDKPQNPKIHYALPKQRYDVEKLVGRFKSMAGKAGEVLDRIGLLNSIFSTKKIKYYAPGNVPIKYIISLKRPM